MKPIVILEIANNHMGNIKHGKKLIKKFYEITKSFKNQINFVLKYQYRDSKTFIHKKADNSNKFVKRFKQTFLSDKEWRQLLNFSSKYYSLACTPFDETSAKKVFSQKFSYVKIASCSATDWPLVEEIYSLYKKKKKKILISLGGLSDKQISRVFSFFNNRKVDFDFLYCVAKYPSSAKDLNLVYFSKLREEYGNCVKGLSLHETSNEAITPIIAYGAGVRIFEKHVGVKTIKYSVNEYSVTPNELKRWLLNLIKAIELWGSTDNRIKNIYKETKQLNSLKRGVFVNKKITEREVIKRKDIYFSFPCKSGQMQANNFTKFYKIVARNLINKDQPLKFSDIKIEDNYSKVLLIRDKIKIFLRNSGVVLPRNPRLEISYHYGIDAFYKYGMTMINIINNQYCKKLLILLPGQSHPAQFHLKKRESFFVLFGNVVLTINNKKFLIKAGELKTIMAKQVHKFSSKNGAIIEELSTTSERSDSYYLDKKINENKDRKTFIYL
jgi:N-acetylneuraminate synthase